MYPRMGFYRGTRLVEVFAGPYDRGKDRPSRSKKKCFSIALRHTLVVLEMH